MKWILIVLSLSTVTAFAKGYGSAGCGLGSMLFEGDNTRLKQVLAATTNGTSLNQSFGISSGTLNCDSPTEGRSAQVQAYIEANKVAFAQDIARGNGETIMNLSKVYGCSDTTSFAKALKNNYSEIFPTADTNTVEITQTVNAVATDVCNTNL
jgi:hypothetical protein